MIRFVVLLVASLVVLRPDQDARRIVRTHRRDARTLQERGRL